MKGQLTVKFVEITSEHSDQRIDNYLFTLLKGVPKSRIYRIIRKGEIRINGSRIKPDYKLNEGDKIRIPPVRIAEREAFILPSKKLQYSLEKNILYEDDALLVLNKPSGLAVHGGSGIKLGLIEALRLIRPKTDYFELVHRIDRETSGCLIVAKKRSSLRYLQEQMRSKRISKVYRALATGKWPRGMRRIDLPLMAFEQKTGEKIVRVNPKGKKSVTIFSVMKRYRNFTLLEALLETGRTHQIRVHAQHIGCPLAGDNKYGLDDINKDIRKSGLKRMFLHALKIGFSLPCGKNIFIEAPMPSDLSEHLMELDCRDEP
ncbi:23S rRNA pseudouridine(955/2504/2580) synthase RluC [Porticoccus sp.]|jgi:23S rRNA pseudouridine955/2504/2580 synthase|nr:23S rRNA pseudouridine(955/2504/2580) synthase RluC [Gammaproteobacteria bacterium]MCH9843004.1 23S rRNA pseudouridine(955/2504/2580) synthase RluC [Gammaproteobacteria bacterium]MDC0887497.1 23S rRNA pseudouridine(955/2504/2580) synthase RluC [Porticoccus sp.]MDC1270436.1 23S rRNA pseudouridine(955/2504/2580) synthase RluC [Porticoccus sp.]